MLSFAKIINHFQQSELGAASQSLPKVIADNIFEELRSSGLRDKDIVAVSSELLGRLTNDIQERAAATEATAKSESH